MVFPIPNYTRIKVRGYFVDLAKAAREETSYGLTGPVQFIPTPIVAINQGSQQIIKTKPFVVFPNPVTGYFSIMLPSTDDPDVVPVNWNYKVIEPTGRSYYIVVPYNTPHIVDTADPDYGTPVIDLVDVVPDPASDAGTIQLLHGRPGRDVTSVTIRQSDNHLVGTYSDNTAWDAGVVDGVQSVSGRVGVVTLTKADVGLNNVNNTADANKPVSTATQTALDLRASLSYVDGGLAGKANASHTHPVSQITATGTANGTTFLRGDGSWATPAGGGGVAPAAKPGLDLLKAALATRDSGPRLLVYTGSSTTAGNNATAVDRRYVNILTSLIQDAYPLRTGAASPATRNLTDTWNARASLTAGIQGVNAGIGGTTSSNYLTTTEINQIGDIEPVMVLHMVGSNDYSSGVNPSTTRTNIESKISSLNAVIAIPHIHVLVQPYQRTDVTSPAFAWSAYGDAMKAIADANPNSVVYLDISNPYILAGIPGADPFDMLDTDNIHQTDAGHALMADLIRNELGVAVTKKLAGAPDTTAPSVPTGLAATPGNAQVALTWNPSTDNVGVNGYRVYRGGTLIASPTTTSYTATGLTNGTAYSFTVAAIDAANNLSAQSASVSSTPVAPTDTTAPTVPTGLTATPGNTQVALNWNASTDAVGVTGYRVYRNGTEIAAPTTTTYTDTGRVNGTQLSYTVAAFDAANNLSAQTAAVTATPAAPTDTTAPTVPTGLTATPGNAQVALSWTASTDAVGVTGYRVYRDAVQVGTPTGTTYTDTGLTNGTAYAYTVAALDAAGNVSAPTAAVNATPAASATLVLSDDFNRANNASSMGNAVTGQAWAPQVSTWGITSNKASTSATSSVTTLIESGVVNHDAQCVIRQTAAGSLPGLVVRAIDDSNRLGIFLDIATNKVQLFVRDAGTNLPIPVNVAPPAGVGTLAYNVDYTVRLVCNGVNLTGYVNGFEAFTYTLTAGAQATKFTGPTVTKVGLRGTTVALFDDLVVNSL